MDNGPGHEVGDTLDRHLTNTTIVRLPPNTTSVSQPLDAGIIMSFKVKCSRLMIQIVSEYSHLQGRNARVPRVRLWGCLSLAWDRVTTYAIQNCFERVPVLPDAMKDLLKAVANAASEAPDFELLQLKAQLMQL
ncbi:hypothetical protein BGZ95_006986, partial [Linnemannia exigua]